MTEHAAGLNEGLTDYGDKDFSRYLRRSFAQSMGYSRAFLDKPVVGIAFTGSDFNNCHRHFPELLAAVKRGVLAAGALPLEFPTISLGEVFLTPTSLKFRNLMAMDTEEMIRAQPMDAVVVIGGCDKTLPAQIMGGGLGRSAGDRHSGRADDGRPPSRRACSAPAPIAGASGRGIAPAKSTTKRSRRSTASSRLTAGTCTVMGTASTMACSPRRSACALPGTAAIPAVHADRLRAAEATGAAAVELIGSKLDADSDRHPAACRERLARAAGDRRLDQRRHPSDRDRRTRRRRSSLDQLNKLSDETPVLVNLKPVGNGYMEDFCSAGGMGALLRELKPLLHLDCVTVTGETLGERLDGDDSGYVDRTIIATRDKPLEPEGGLVALFGNLAPQGRDPQALRRRRKAVRARRPRRRVRLARRSRRRASTIRRSTLRPNDILVLQNAGPQAPAGMPEAGYLPIPKKLAQRGRQGHGPHLRRAHERHRFRHHRAACHAGRGIRRAARAGAHRRPHPALGEANAASNCLVDDAELKKRAAVAPPAAEQPERGYAKLFAEQILGADEGCDFKFLMPNS